MENTTENPGAAEPDDWFSSVRRSVRTICHQITTHITFSRHRMREASIVEVLLKIVEESMTILEATLPMMASMTALTRIGYTIRTTGWSVFLGLQFLRGTPLSLLVLRDSFVFFDFYTNVSLIERIGTMVLSVIF